MKYFFQTTFVLLAFYAIQSTASNNSACVTVVQQAIDAVEQLTTEVSEIRKVATIVVNQTVPNILESVTEIQDKTIPDALKTVQSLTDILDQRTARGYLVGTIALGTSATVVITLTGYAAFLAGSWKIQQWHAGRVLREAIAHPDALRGSQANLLSASSAMVTALQAYQAALREHQQAPLLPIDGQL